MPREKSRCSLGRPASTPISLATIKGAGPTPMQATASMTPPTIRGSSSLEGRMEAVAVPSTFWTKKSLVAIQSSNTLVRAKSTFWPEFAGNKVNTVSSRSLESVPVHSRQLRQRTSSSTRRSQRTKRRLRRSPTVGVLVHSSRLCLVRRRAWRRMRARLGPSRIFARPMASVS